MNPDRYLRPEAVVLGEGSLIPPENQIRPAPNRFTHKLAGPAPFYFGSEAGSEEPDGHLEARTKVVLLRHDGGARCRVVDERGLYVEVNHESLTELKKP
jgi:hypothetical protein